MALLLLASTVEFTTGFLSRFAQSVIHGGGDLLQPTLLQRSRRAARTYLLEQEFWEQQFELDKLARPITRETLTIDAPVDNDEPTIIEVRREFWMPKDHVLVEEMRGFSGPGSDFITALIAAALGAMEVDGKPLEFSSP